jgi:uncharacterized protein (TIGR02246 family)
MSKKWLLVLPALLLTIVGSPARADQSAAPSASKDVEAIRGLIQQTEKAINSNDPGGIMAHYSRDIVVSYPGVPDTTYDQFAAAYKRMLDPSTTTSTVADVQEIVVAGDLAIVRMTWSTTVTEKASGKNSSRKAKDLQVWRRENGQWKFFRGMWHHIKPE